MEWIISLLPEQWIGVNILLLLAFVGVYKLKRELRLLYDFTNFSLIILFILVIFQGYVIFQRGFDSNLNLHINDLILYSNGMFEIFSKTIIALIAIFINIMFGVYFKNDEKVFNHKYFKPDLLPLYFIMLLGSFVLVSSNDLLTFLISFELIAIPSYFVIAMDSKNPNALEASIKYFLIGSLATVSIIFAILLFYIYTGSFVIDKILVLKLNFWGTKIAFVLLILGILIKLAVFPLSFWIQDAYEGSRTPYLLVISTLPKLAIVIVFIKFVFINGTNLPGFLGIFAILSMIMGTFWALTHNKIKKILAFSTITNMGYLLIPFISVGYNIVNNAQALAIAYFYILQYVLSVVLFISVLIYIENEYNEEISLDLEKLKGILNKSTILSVFLLVSLISMAGLPPSAGFIAKFMLFAYSYSFSPLLVWIGIITTIVSLYFYYKIAQYLYIKDEENRSNKFNMDFLSAFSNSLLATLIILLGFFPAFVINVVQFIILSIYK